MEVDPRLAGWLLILFGCSGLYARFLSAIREWYDPDWTALTVMGGNGLIVATLYGLEWSGFAPAGTTWLSIITNVSAGIPIVIWQAIQYIKRHTRNGHD